MDEARLARARSRWATRLFSYADCADPHVDFEGAALLAHPSLATRAADPRAGGAGPVRLLGVATAQRPDGPDHAAALAAYDHLAQAYREALAQADRDFAGAYHGGEALLEAYTCFPPVPLGFLRATGLAPDDAALDRLLSRHPVTVTGGMNLAGAPWNNPVLNALIVMHQRLTGGEADLGLLHGNGGLGGWQGVALLG